MWGAGADGYWLTEDVTTHTVSYITIGNPIMFTGRWWDTTTKLYYYRFRDYSPELGRFLQTDPTGYIDTMNLYAYCGNNPVNWIDPWGLISILTPVAPGYDPTPPYYTGEDSWKLIGKDLANLIGKPVKWAIKLYEKGKTVTGIFERAKELDRIEEQRRQEIIEMKLVIMLRMNLSREEVDKISIEELELLIKLTDEDVCPAK